MPTTPTLNGQILGEAEHAARAVLDRLLARTGNTFHHWVALNFTAVSGGSVDRDQLIGRMTGALKIDESVVLAAIEDLTASDLLKIPSSDGSRIVLTTAGQARHSQLRAAIAETTARLYADLPADDLATAGRVLTIITARANAELADA